MNNTNTLNSGLHLEAATMYALCSGLNVLPAVRDRKYPIGINWRKYQNQPATEEEITKWYRSGQYKGLCIITGNGVEAIDFDDVPTAEQFWARLSEIDGGAELASRLTVQRTPSGGMHIVYRVTDMEVPGNQKLAMGSFEVPGAGRYALGRDGEPAMVIGGGSHGLEARQGADGNYYINPTLIETRGAGGLIMAAPTEGYEVVEGSFMDVATLTPKERDLLIELAQSFDQGGAAKANAKSTQPREPWVPDRASPRDRYSLRASAEEVVAILNAAGWQDAGGDKDRVHLTRPGKEEGTSGTVHRDNGVFHCFTTNGDPFEEGESYSPFKVRALLEFEGDLDAADQAVLEEEREMWGEISGEIMQPIEEATERAAGGDVGAPLELEVVEQLAALRQINPAEFSRVRQRIKQANRNVPMRELDRALNSAVPDSYNNDGPSVADRLVEMVRGVAELFHDQDDRRYASFEHHGHVETWDLDSKGFREWLGMRLFREEGKAPRDQSIKDAANALAGIAKFEGHEQKVWLRAAIHEGRNYLDMCDDGWRAIEVSAEGWKVVDRPPVKFRRTSNMASLPEPQRQGDVDLLWGSVNVPEEARPLALAFLLDALQPDTDFPVFELEGEQGCGKSITQDRLRALIDPSTGSLRSSPKNADDIFISAHNNWVLSYNNLSHLSPDMQDALCGIATEGAHSGRTLYTNTDETVFVAKRPTMINGISTTVTAQDLLSRTVRLSLPPIEKRKSKRELQQEFEENAPIILGGLLDLFCATLKKLPDVEPENLPRMSDFAKLGEAMLQAQGSPPGRFLGLYSENRQTAAIDAMDASPVICALREFARAKGIWTGTHTDLYRELSVFKLHGAGWPTSPIGLARAIKRERQALGFVGVEVEPLERTREARPIKITYTPKAEGDEIPTEGGVPRPPAADLIQYADGHEAFAEIPPIGEWVQ